MVELNDCTCACGPYVGIHDIVHVPNTLIPKRHVLCTVYESDNLIYIIHVHVRVLPRIFLRDSAPLPCACVTAQWLMI